MSAHEAWHVLVLVATLLGAAAAAILLVAPLAFEEPPAGLRRARPWLAAVAVLGGLALLVEWLIVHPGWL